jgi:transcriptional regulator with XRE-family HTH domain
MWYVKPKIWYYETGICKALRTRGLAAQDRSGLHSPSVPPFEGLGQALEALRRRKGWSAAEAARRTGIDQSNLRKYERNAKGITTATLDHILDAYGVTLEELAAILREVQGGPSIRWIVPGEVSEGDLRLVVRKVLGKDWVPDEDEESEEETAPDEERPDGDANGDANGDEDDG